jgi:hypothetical protein
MLAFRAAMATLRALPLLAHGSTIGIRALSEPATRLVLDSEGLFWVTPFARGDSGSVYGWRLSLGDGNGAVVRTANGHAVTVAARPSDAIFAVLALERLLIGPKARAKLAAGWNAALPVLREAVTATGGDPARLDGLLHVVDELAPWKAHVPPAEARARRACLATILDDPMLPVTGDETGTPAPWTRARDSLRAPDDAAAGARLLAGNHGLDGSRAWAGLDADQNSVAAALQASARAARQAGTLPGAPWVAMAEPLAEGREPDARQFLEAIVGRPAEEGWEGLAAATFWMRRATRRVPEELMDPIEEMLQDAGRDDLIAARHA